MTEEPDTRWYPLSVRESGDYAAYDALHPGVPEHLGPSLWKWTVRQIESADDLLMIERRFGTLGKKRSFESMLAELRAQVRASDKLFWDVVELFLSRLNIEDFGPSRRHYQEVEADRSALVDLAVMLDEARSLWTVQEDTSGTYSLQRRVSPAVQAVAEQAMSTGDKAAQHLRLAWQAVYGLEPDPGKGYREAIKAMEVATIPVVCPSNTRATLNRVINDLRAKPSKWAVNLKHPTPDRQVETVADMLDLVWKGQSDRHGDPDPSAPISVSQEQAEAAVHLAVTVVQWFNTGVVTIR